MWHFLYRQYVTFVLTATSNFACTRLVSLCVMVCTRHSGAVYHTISQCNLHQVWWITMHRFVYKWTVLQFCNTGCTLPHQLVLGIQFAPVFACGTLEQTRPGEIIRNDQGRPFCQPLNANNNRWDFSNLYKSLSLQIHWSWQMFKIVVYSLLNICCPNQNSSDEDMHMFMATN